jgi:hypothetical protein
MHQILSSNLIFFAFDSQAPIKMSGIEPEDGSKFFSKCVIFRSKILQKLWIFPK